MPEAALVRTVRFSAGHHYRRPGWTDEENRRAFGSAVDPHGHDWSLTVTVRGPVDPETGFVADLAQLDALLRSEVVERFDQRDLNEVVAPVREGAMQPTTEALACWLFERLAPRIPGDARLVKVRLAESDDLAAECREGG